MSPYILALALIVLSSPSFSQDSSIAEKLLPPGVTKAEFFGDILAVIAFCNLTNHIDQYEMAAGMRFFGVTSSDRAAMESARDKRYDVYRRQFSTPTKHEEFCKSAPSHPLLMKTMRSGYHSFPGSDDRRQPEKIEFFGNFLGTMVFCNYPVDADKWGRFLFDMGVQVESMTALGNQAKTTQQALVNQYGSPQKGSGVCAEVRANPSVERFMKK